MCGIAGWISWEGAPPDPELLRAMGDRLAHRGPDDAGYLLGLEAGLAAPPVDPDRTDVIRSRHNLGLVHRRLSIIDLEGGHQPLSNETGDIWVVFNGEIYNFQHLYRELASLGHRFRTRSDTEVIVHAYEAWGPACVERFRGMFAFAVWDNRAQRLFLARDRVGKKPLYYAALPGGFAFASEIKSLTLVKGLSTELDLEALKDYLSLLYVPSPKSIFRDVRKLPPAHAAVVSSEGVSVRRYWDVSYDAASSPRSFADAAGRIWEELRESVELRMISDVPLGAFLSGGVDSSAVVAAMAEVSDRPVVTNSITFPEARYDEGAYARRVADLFGADHQQFQVTPEAVPVVETLAWHYDEPFADSSAVPTYYVSRMARQRVKVALSGDGGDENFAGYRRYYFDLREHKVRNLVPEPLRGPLFRWLGRLYPKADYLPRIFRGKAFLSNVARDPVEAYFHSVSAIPKDELDRLLTEDVRASLGGYETSELFRDVYAGSPAPDHLSRLLHLDIRTYLCGDILTKVDRASMAVSLEVRCPILDHRFVEFAANIPAAWKLRGREGKYVFKKALERRLPKEILYRKKMGFGVPIPEWFRGPLRAFAREKILDGEASRLLLNRKRLETLWKQHQARTRDRATELWTVMMLNLWHQRYGTGARARTASSVAGA